MNICPFSGNNVLNMTEEDVAVDSTSFSYKIVYRELVVVQRVTEKFDSMDGMRTMKKKKTSGHAHVLCTLTTTNAATSTPVTTVPT